MTLRFRLFIGAVIVIAVSVAGVGAYAYFTGSGTGTNVATTGTLQPVTAAAFVGGDTQSTLLVPGGTADVILRVNNPNAHAVKLVTVAGGPASISVDGGHPACTTTGVSFTNQTGLSTTIAASGTTLVHLPGAAAMSMASSSGCQGATFSIPVSITVRTS